MDASNLSLSLRKKDTDKPRQIAAQHFFVGSWNLKAGFDHGDPLMPFTNESERVAFTEHCVENWQEPRYVGCQMPNVTLSLKWETLLTSN